MPAALRCCTAQVDYCRCVDCVMDLFLARTSCVQQLVLSALLCSCKGTHGVAGSQVMRHGGCTCRVGWQR